MSKLPIHQNIYVYMASTPSVYGRKRYLKLGHGFDPRERMMDYSTTHTYKKFRFLYGIGFTKNNSELKPITSSLRMWKIKGDVNQARLIELELAWYLHNELNLKNRYLSALKQHLAGELHESWKTTDSGDLVWSGPKELHELGFIKTDQSNPTSGPTAKFRQAVEEIDRMLRTKGFLLD